MHKLRTLVLLLLTLLFVGCAPAQYPPSVVPSTLGTSISSTIALYRGEGGEDDSICAGVRISPTEVLTAWHCAFSAAAPDDLMLFLMLDDAGLNSPLATEYNLHGKTVEISSFEEVKAVSGTKKPRARSKTTVLAYDVDSDLALLFTEKSSQPFSPFRDRPLVVGEPVYHVGHPLGLEFSSTFGRISYPCRRIDTKVCYIQVDILVAPGSSGGGLYDSEGYLLGITSAYAVPGISIFSHPERIAALLKSVQ